MNISANNEALAEEVDVVVLAVKPQILREISFQIAQTFSQEIIGRVDRCRNYPRQFAQWLGKRRDRALHAEYSGPGFNRGHGAVCQPHVNDEQKDLAENILRSVGLTLWVRMNSTGCGYCRFRQWPGVLFSADGGDGKVSSGIGAGRASARF